MKLKSFCKAKGTFKRTKWQPTEWEKIFINSTFDRELISKIYKALKKLDIKNNQTIQFKKMGYRSKQRILNREISNSQETLEMFDILNYQENANRNNSEISS